MQALFLKLLSMSVPASLLVLFVIAVRSILKKAPRAIICLLWLAVGIRLVCPISIESPLSLVPNTDEAIQNIVYPNTDTEDTGDITVVLPPEMHGTVSPTEPLSPPPPTFVGSEEKEIPIVKIACTVWACGVVCMSVYMAVSYILIKKRVSVYITDKSGVRRCDGIDTPFILGVIRPRIYIPSDMTDERACHVIAHEKAHIKRLDHLWKPLGFVLLSLYWFDPLMWIAYVLLCKDIEIACDERVIAKRGEEYRKEYSSALLACSMPRKIISACPLAFGEVGVKERIKKVMSYKKPTLWISLAALILAIAACVFFLTDRAQSDGGETGDGESVTDFERLRVLGASSTLEGLGVRVTDVSEGDGDIKITVEWKNKSGYDIEYGEPFSMLEYDSEGNTVPIDSDVVFILPAYVLRRGATVTKTYNISLYRIEEGKKYRFVTSFRYMRGGEGGNATLSVDLYIYTDEDKVTETLPPESIKKAENYRFLTNSSTEDKYRYISLHPDGRATLYLSRYTSISCTYEKKEDTLVLHSDNYMIPTKVYTFTLVGDDYVFNAEKSSGPPQISSFPAASAVFYAFRDGSVFERCESVLEFPFSNSVKGDLDGNGTEDCIYYNGVSVNGLWEYFSFCVTENDFIKGSYFIPAGRLITSVLMYSDDSGKIYAELKNTLDERTVLEVGGPGENSYRGISLTKNGYDAYKYLTDTCYAAAFGKEYTVIYSSNKWNVTINDKGRERQVLVGKDLSEGGDKIKLYICTDGEINATAEYKASDLSSLHIDVKDTKSIKLCIADKNKKEQEYLLTENNGEIILTQNMIPAPKELN